MNTHRPLKKSRLASAVCHSLVWMGVMQGTSHAATLVVTSNADAGSFGCEFREAVNAVNVGGASGGCVNINPIQAFGFNDQIIVSPNNLASSTITLQQGEITIDENVIINGFDGLTIDGNLASRVFTIQDSTVLLNTITFTRGDTEDSGGAIRANSSIVSLMNSKVTRNRSGFGNGGGISAVASTILLTNSNVSGNRCLYDGGGIYAGSGSLISLTNSKVDENTSYRGGGIAANFNSSISLSNSTVIKNLVSISGGGIAGRSNVSMSLRNSAVTENRSGYQGGGIAGSSNTSISLMNSTVNENTSSAEGGGVSVSFDASISLINSTVSGNNSRLEGGGGVYGVQSSISLINSTVSGNNSRLEGGGGVYGVQSSISLINSTIAQNSSGNSSGGNFYSRSSAVSLVNSILANAEAGGDCVAPTGVLTIDNATIIEDGSCNTSRAIDPKLGPLADNGGNTLTHALLPTSPARNTGVLATCEAEDQRGQTRNTGDNACDVGAIEFNANDDFGEADANFFVIPLANKKAVVIPL